MSATKKLPDPSTPASAAAREQVLLSSRQVTILFWSAAALVFLNWVDLHEQYAWESQLAYGLISIAALLPLYLWTKGYVYGIPIFPAFAGFQFMAFGMPLLSNHPGITSHSPDDHLAAGVIVASTLLAGTAGWLLAGNRRRAPVPFCRQLGQINSDRVLFASITLAILFEGNLVFNWVSIPGGLFSVLRGVIGGISTLAFFILGQHMGSKQLSLPLKVGFITSVIAMLFIQSATLLLINAISVAALAIGGFTLGSRRPPWVVIVVLVSVISFLHLGKGKVREAYWGENRESNLHSLVDTLGMFDFWIVASFEAMGEKRENREENEKASAFQRASLMHLFLYQKSMLDNGHTYLHGDTYSIIPSLLVPRFIDPTKPWSLEGTTRLNVHFGLQTREETLVTTIGWGLFNEAYANYGFIGTVAMGFFAGAVAGWITFLSQGFPFLSFRSLTAILVLSTSFQTEHSLGVLITSLFQSFVGIIGFSLVFMKNLPTAEWIHFFQKPSAVQKKRRNLAV
jgi:hypothetical protein